MTTLSGSILRLALPNSNKLTPHIKMMSRASSARIIFRDEEGCTEGSKLLRRDRPNEDNERRRRWLRGEQGGQ